MKRRSARFVTRRLALNFNGVCGGRYRKRFENFAAQRAVGLRAVFHTGLRHTHIRLFSHRELLYLGNARRGGIEGA